MYLSPFEVDALLGLRYPGTARGHVCSGVLVIENVLSEALCSV